MLFLFSTVYLLHVIKKNFDKESLLEVSAKKSLLKYGSTSKKYRCSEDYYYVENQSNKDGVFYKK